MGMSNQDSNFEISKANICKCSHIFPQYIHNHILSKFSSQNFDHSWVRRKFCSKEGLQIIVRDTGLQEFQATISRNGSGRFDIYEAVITSCSQFWAQDTQFAANDVDVTTNLSNCSEISEIVRVMDATLLLSVNFRGVSKLIQVDQSTSFSDFQTQVLCKWSQLNVLKVSFVYSLGTISNCCLESDEDLKNLRALCFIESLKVVVVELCLSVNHITSYHDSIQGGSKGFVGSNNVLDYMDSEVIIAPNSAKKTKTLLQLDSIGVNDALPYYDICPAIDKKPLLSDSWRRIMKDGVGSVFSGGAIGFKTELIKYSTKLGFKFKYQRNDGRYTHVVCKDDLDSECGWFIKARRQAVTSYFEITKADLTHSCIGKLHNVDTSRMSPNIMRDFVMQTVRSDPTVGSRKIINLIKEGYGFDISYFQAWRTVEAARIQIFGSYEESYDHLRWYCAAIERTNPGSVALLERNPVTKCFERLFIAFNACIDGFAHCRPMLFIDGTFMKGRAKGTLLSATAKDGNNGLFPVAFAIVSAENTSNWTWFLEKLRDFIKHEKQIFYISDINCGLMSAFSNVFEDAVHFFCLFHLLSNLKGHFSSGWTNSRRAQIGDHFKECAYASNRRIFEEKIAIFKEIGGKIAEEWLEQLPYEKWAVAYSPHITRYGEMTSNAAESFNSWIDEARSLPITHMVDSIRIGISKWYVQRRKASSMWSGALVASKEELWNTLSEFGLSWYVVECPSGDFEVLSNPSVRVDLRFKVCTCYQWQVTGFPCSHAVAVIRKHCTSVVTHVEDYFFTSKYKECYEVDIHPIPETERFECQSNVHGNKILPPNLKRPAGRPKKQRIPSYGEYPKKKPKICTKCCKMVKHDTFTCSVVTEEADHHTNV